MRLLLAGEGSTELGDLAGDRAYRTPPLRKGVIEALVGKIAARTFEVVDGVPWKSGSLYRAGASRSAETRRVLGLLQDARDPKGAALVFGRDLDGHTERECDIERALEEAGSLFPTLALAGGVAINEIEAWLFALEGRHGSEAITNPDAAFTATHPGQDHLDAKVAIVEAADLGRIPEDARSLHLWLSRARAVLSTASTS